MLLCIHRYLLMRAQQLSEKCRTQPVILLSFCHSHIHTKLGSVLVISQEWIGAFFFFPVGSGGLRQDLCTSGWPWSWYLAEDNNELQIFCGRMTSTHCHAWASDMLSKHPAVSSVLVRKSKSDTRVCPHVYMKRSFRSLGLCFPCLPWFKFDQVVLGSKHCCLQSLAIS